MQYEVSLVRNARYVYRVRIYVYIYIYTCKDVQVKPPVV